MEGEVAHKILVVDDEKINVTVVKFRIAEKGYEVSLAYDGEEGLKKVQSDKPDLIILDVQMPNMNGYEFMTELKQLEGFESIPVIMLTANETMQDVFQLEGVKGYFVKPVDFDALFEKINECLGPNN